MDKYVWFSIFVAVNALVLFVLAANVSRLRLKLRVSLGDGGHNDIMLAMRAHCNGLEQVPIFALTILALTLLDSIPVVLASLVIAFTLARLLHAYGMLGHSFRGRRVGAGFTYLLQLVAIIILLVQTLGLSLL